MRYTQPKTQFRKLNNDIYAAHKFEESDYMYMKYNTKGYDPITKEEFEKGTVISEEEADKALTELKGF